MASRPSSIERLPEELRLCYISYCDSSTVLNLCLTSKTMFNLCVNSLFCHIDLSIHNDDVWHGHANSINISVLPDHAEAKPRRPSDASILRRQHQLLERLNEQPDVGLQTRVLRWTLFDHSNVDGELRDGFNPGSFDLWRAFTCFSNITEIDLAFMTESREIHPPPQSLFRTATSVSLAGTASYTVISTILTSIQPSRLLHLRFNKLQILADENIGSHPQTLHGAARGFLADLTGQCTALQSLHLLTTAESFDGSYYRPMCPYPRWLTEVAYDSRRYAEIGAFIESVKPTLRELVFERGPDIHYVCDSGGQRYHLWLPAHEPDFALPMDIYFDTHVLPVLTSGPWPRLGKLTVRGIGHWKTCNAGREDATVEETNWLHGETADFRNKTVRIREAAPKECQVAVEAEASMPFYRF